MKQYSQNLNKKMNKKNSNKNSTSNQSMPYSVKEIIIPSCIKKNLPNDVKEQFYHISTDWIEIIYPEKMVIINNDYSPIKREIIFDEQEKLDIDGEVSYIQNKHCFDEKIQYLPYQEVQTKIIIQRDIFKSSKESPIQFVFEKFREMKSQTKLHPSKFFIEILDKHTDIHNPVIKEQIISFIHSLN
jgi:hypothetical protein